MPEDNHRCPARGCEKQVPHDMLMCPRHWYMVPRPVQYAVYRAWADGAGEGSDAHHAAVDAAIGAVNRRLPGA